jgi:hypothetical protein
LLCQTFLTKRSIAADNHAEFHHRQTRSSAAAGSPQTWHCGRRADIGETAPAPTQPGKARSSALGPRPKRGFDPDPDFGPDPDPDPDFDPDFDFDFDFDGRLAACACWR